MVFDSASKNAFAAEPKNNQVIQVNTETGNVVRKFDIKKMGLAFGLTGALLYLGCMLLMATVGPDNSIKFFNSLLHGLDVSSIIRTGVPLWEAGVGIVQTFILGWLIGACIGGFYNVFTIKRNRVFYRQKT